MTPRSDNQVILFSVLGLIAFSLTIGSGVWLAARRRWLTP